MHINTRAPTKLTAISLFIVMIYTIISLSVTPAYADANIEGSGLTGNVGGGAWVTEYQGIRISILDKYGNYALALGNNYYSLDILSTRVYDLNVRLDGKDVSGQPIDLTMIDMFYGGTRALEHSINNYTYRATGTEGSNQDILDRASKEIHSKIFYAQSYYNFVTPGSSNNIYQVVAPPDGASSSKILNLQNDEYRPLEKINGTNKFKLHGVDIGKLIYGDPDAGKPANDSLMYLLFNTYHNGGDTGYDKGSPVWKLTDVAINKNKIPKEVAMQYEKGISDPNRNKWYLTLKLCQDYEFMICVEPIMFVDIRYTGGALSGVVLYGTPTNIAEGIEKLVASGDLNDDPYIHKGGWDVSLFRPSKHSFILSKTWKYATDEDKKLYPDMVQREYINNSNVENNKYNVPNDILVGSLSDKKVEGYAMHLYKLIAQPKTHTWDKKDPPPGIPEPGPAPDPKTDPPTKDKIKDEKQLKYNIVKFYEDWAGDTPEAGVTHVGTYIRNNTLPKILIEDEKIKEDANGNMLEGYEVYEWMYSDKPIPSITAYGKSTDTKWSDIEGAVDPGDEKRQHDPDEKDQGHTKTLRVGDVNITYTGTDSNATCTLYVRLKRKSAGTHTWDNINYRHRV